LIAAAAQAIREYLTVRPCAADTAEGIHAYWIQWGESPEMIEVTEAALLELEQQGFVERAAAGNRLLWRRRHAASALMDDSAR
jgi:hypothetical protein